MSFLHHGFSNGSSNGFSVKKHNRTGCICLAFLQCVFQMSPQIACMSGCIITQVAFVWLFSTMRFQMCPQIACLIGCIITQVAFVGLFSTVCFQMSPQTACLIGCKSHRLHLFVFSPPWVFRCVLKFPF